MAIFRNSGQSAAAAGTTLDTTNGALPDAPTQIVPGTGGTITIENDAASPGSKCIQVVAATATAGYWGYTGMSGANNTAAARGLWKSPATTVTGQNHTIVRILSSGGGTALGSLVLSDTGKLQITADIATTTGTPSSSTVAVNTWYDISIQMENPTTGTGVVVVTVRDLSNTIITGLSINHGGAIGAGTANFQTSTIGTFRLGRVSATTGALTTRWKYWTFVTGSAAAITAQPGNNALPTVPAVTPKIQSGLTSTSFTAVPSDSDGTIASHAWVVTKPDGTNLSTGVTGATTATVTIAGQSTAGSYKLDYTATDDAGGTASITTWLFVARGSGVAARPYKVQSNAGTWTAGGAASSVLDGVAGDSTKWIVSVDNPATASIVLNMEVPQVGQYDVSFYLSWAGSDGTTLVAGVVGPVTCQVFQGVTPITSQMIFNQPAAGWLLCAFSFTTIQSTALSVDLSDIRIELQASQT